MKSSKHIISVILVIFSWLTLCNLTLTAQSTLTYDQYLEQVRKYHPIMIQSDLIVSSAQYELQVSKADFDPNLLANYRTKTFKDSPYFDNIESGFKWATNAPVTIGTGFIDNSGGRLNPENSLGFIPYIGADVALLKGFLADERRAYLNKSKVGVERSLFAQQIIQNDLFLDASDAYFQWVATKATLDITQDFLQITQLRRDLIYLGFINGERSPLDTLETFTQIQNLSISLNKAIQDYINARLYASLFLWDSAHNPYLIAENVIPDPLSNIEKINSLIDTLGLNNSPWIREMLANQKMVEIDRKLYAQSVLPQLDLQFKYYAPSDANQTNLKLSPLAENYSIEFAFKAPIFLRAERYKLKIAENKLTDIKLKMDQKNWDLILKVNKLQNEQVQLEKQIKEIKSQIVNFNTLRDMEMIRLNQGESSIFMVNTRESKVLESELKRIELLTKKSSVINKSKWLTFDFIRQ
jgi:outer membrane protein TolC